MVRPRSATPRPYLKANGDTVWRVRYEHNGHTRSRTLPNRLAADLFAKDLNAHGPEYALEQLADTDHAEAMARTAPLDATAARFFEWKSSRVRSPRTVPDYRRDYAAVIAPRFGDRPIGTISAADIQQWVDQLVAGKIGGGLSAKSIRDRHALLHQILEWAAHPSRKLIDANPAKGTDLPRRVRPKPKGIMPAEWQAIEAALRLLSPDAADLATFIVGSGWRWSEVAALTAAAVEDYGPGQPVYVTMAQVARRGENNRVEIVQDGKAAASLRRIHLTGAAATITRARAAGKTPDALVFTNGGKPWTNNAMWNYWGKAVATAGVASKPSLHALRHTHVGWMVMAGASLADIKARVGHANVATTIDVYGGMISDVRPDVLAAFDRLATTAPAVAASPQRGAIAAGGTSPDPAP